MGPESALPIVTPLPSTEGMILDGVWLGASTLGALAVLAVILRRRDLPERRPTGGLLLLLVALVWLNPITQLALGWSAYWDLAKDLGGYVGQPLEVIEDEFGPLRREQHGAGLPYYDAEPWWAPLRVGEGYRVKLVCFEPDVLGLVHADD